MLTDRFNASFSGHLFSVLLLPFCIPVEWTFLSKILPFLINRDYIVRFEILIKFPRNKYSLLCTTLKSIVDDIDLTL